MTIDKYCVLTYMGRQPVALQKICTHVILDAGYVTFELNRYIAPFLPVHSTSWTVVISSLQKNKNLMDGPYSLTVK